MKYLSNFSPLLLTFILVSCSGEDVPPPGTNLEATVVAVGKNLFDDHDLSVNDHQGCSSCHDPKAGFTDPSVSSATPVSEGAIAGSFGTRNAPTIAYSHFSPPFSRISDQVHGPVFIGGQFYDGRSQTLEDQAVDPFLSAIEMANPSKNAVVSKVSRSIYVAQFTAVYGNDIFNDADAAFEKIIQAITAFERSDEVNPFNSKFDCFLQDADQFPLSTQEQAGLNLFDGAARCSSCHSLDPEPIYGKVLLTNFQYFNIGVPSNPDNPANKADVNFVDLGLGGRLSDNTEHGKFKTPTLRNIALTSPYMHNGVFDTLEEVVAFFNIDEKKTASPAPEVNINISSEVDYLGLDDPVEINAIVAFMKTLTDGTGVGVCF